MTGKCILKRFHKITHTFLTSREPRRLEVTTAICKVNTYKIIYPLDETHTHTHTHTHTMSALQLCNVFGSHCLEQIPNHRLEELNWHECKC